jgi:hypothetical protein
MAYIDHLANFSEGHLDGPQEFHVGDHKSEFLSVTRKIRWWEGGIGR